tara:strand:- start:10891 stop:15885 length:4995 start_codon:yes stop_codon:yes gene_type:complete
MEPEVIEDLFNRAVSQGYGKSIDDFKLLLSTNEEVLTDNFNHLKANGYSEERTIEDFSILVGVKKKEETEVSPSPSVLVQEDTEPVQPGVQPQEEESGSSDLPVVRVADNIYADYISSLDPSEKLKISSGAPTSDIALENMLRDPENFPDSSLTPFALSARNRLIIDEDLGPTSQIVPSSVDGPNMPGEIGAVINEDGAAPNWLTKQVNSAYHWLGEAYGALQSADQFIGDATRIYPAAEAASLQRESLSSGMDMLFAGGDATDRLIETYISDTNNLQNMPGQDEMMAVQNDFVENGGGFWGMLIGLKNNPGAAIQQFMTSQLAMANPESIAGFTAITGGSFSVVAGLTPGPVPVKAAAGAGAAARASKYGYGVAAGILETGLSFNEFMQEELGDREFNIENVRSVLQDPEALQRIRVKSATRGGIIAGIDLIGAKLLGDWGSKYVAKSGNFRRLTGATIVGEGVTGFVGEATAQIVTTGKVDKFEAYMEGLLPGVGGAPFTLAGTIANPASHTINGHKLDRRSVYEKVKNAKSPEELNALNIKIANDPEFQKYYDRTQTRLEIESDLPSSMSELDRAEVIQLETLRRQLAGSPMVFNQNRVKKIDKRLGEIAEKYIDPTKLETTESEATDGAEPVAVQPPVNPSGETSQPEGAPESLDPIEPTPIETPEALEARLKQIRLDGLKREGIYLGKTGFSRSIFREIIDQGDRYFRLARGYMPISAYKANDKRLGAIKSSAYGLQATNQKYESLVKSEVKDGKDKVLVDQIINTILDGKKLPKELQGYSQQAEDLAVGMRNEIDALSQALIDSGMITPETGTIKSVKPGKEPGTVDIEISDPESGEVIFTETRKGNVKNFTEGESIDFGTLENIKSNLGSYVTRAYALFEGTNWKETVSDQAKNRARNYLMNEIRGTKLHQDEIKRSKDLGLKRTDEQVLEAIAFAEIESMLSASDMEGWHNTSKIGAADKSKLKRKQDLPVELRALFGELTGPMERFSSTVVNQAGLLANVQFQQAIREAGLGVWLFDKNDSTKPKGFDVEIAAAGSKTYDILGGLSTTKEVAAALDGYKQQKNANALFALWKKGVATAKWSNTVGDVRVHLRNFEGNISFMLANGHTDITEFGPAIQALSNSMSSMSDDQLNAKIQEYISNGLISNDTALGEIRNILAEGAKEDYTEGVIRNDNKKGFLKKGVDFASGIYGATDNLFKIFAYEQELARMSEALFGVDQSELNPEQSAELKTYVSDLVRNTYPTYDRVPKVAQDFAANPFTATFVAFQAEQIRVSYNISMQIAQELTSTNPKVKAIGMKRLAGLGTYVGLKGAGKATLGIGGIGGVAAIPAYIMGGGVGVERDEQFRRDAGQFMAPWVDPDQTVINVDMIDGEPHLIVQDLGSTDGLGNVESTITKFINEIVTLDPETGELKMGDPRDALREAFYQQLSPFAGEDIMAKLLLDIRGDVVSGEGKYFNPERSDAANAGSWADAFYQALEPGTISRVRNEIMDYFEFTNIYGTITRSSKDFGSLFEVLTGTTEYKLPLSKAIKYRAYDTVSRLDNIAALRSAPEYRELSEEEFLEVKLEKYEEIAKEMHEYYSAIINLTSKDGVGLDPAEAADIITDIAARGMTKDRKAQFRYQMVEGKYTDFFYTDSERKKIQEENKKRLEKQKNER